MKRVALAVSLLATAPAFASVVQIDFETPTSFASIASFYAGGSDGAGASGPNLGVRFSDEALALQNDATGTYFSNAPSPLGVMTPVGASAVMDVAQGFVGLSFFYSSLEAAADAVEIWSGLGGTGTLLATLSLANNAQAGCSDSALCHFDLLSAGLSQRAYSVTFGGANVAVFDNVSLTVPEPATALLVALGLVGAAASRRRR
jgi:PEP-CTERM motif